MTPLKNDKKIHRNKDFTPPSQEFEILFTFRI